MDKRILSAFCLHAYSESLALEQFKIISDERYVSLPATVFERAIGGVQPVVSP